MAAFVNWLRAKRLQIGEWLYWRRRLAGSKPRR
jgi:hypothetical protein